MNDLINKLKSPKTKAAFMSYLRAVLASAVTMAIALAADVAPEYAVLIGALAAPAAKWADKTEKEYGLGSKEQPLISPIRRFKTLSSSRNTRGWGSFFMPSFSQLFSANSQTRHLSGISCGIRDGMCIINLLDNGY